LIKKEKNKASAREIEIETMAYDEYLSERISQNLTQRKIFFEGKKMFGGIAFMVNYKMCVGVVKNQLMARVGPSAAEEALKRPCCKIMDFTGRPMKGYVFVLPDGTDNEEDLDYYVDLALVFNEKLVK